MKTHRRYLAMSAGTLLVVALAAIRFNMAFAEDAAVADPLQRLMDGNKRFVAGACTHPDQTSERRTEIAKGQHPFAVVLTCADSRVSPELLFDQGLGDLFVLRVAGNTVDDQIIGSIEYAVEHLHAPLIIVLGHRKCGAVQAAVKGGEVPGHIRSLVEFLQPSVEASKDMPGDAVDNAVKKNVERVAGILQRVEPILGEAAKDGKLKVVGACYDLDTGAVEFYPSAVRAEK
jgi:carbonic anhydrase